MLHIWLHIHLQSCAFLRVLSCEEKVGDLGGPIILSRHMFNCRTRRHGYLLDRLIESLLQIQ